MRQWRWLILAAAAACTRGEAEGPDVDYRDLVVGSTASSVGEGALSPDGQRLAFSRVVDGLSRIFVAAADGANPVQVSPAGRVPYYGSLWSPDGQWLAVQAGSNDADIVLLPAGGGEPRTLVDGPGLQGPDSWLPDGSGVVGVEIRDGRGRMFIAPRAGGPQRPLLADTSGATFGTVSPDQTQIAYQTTVAGRTSVWVMPAQGGTPRRLTEDGLESIGRRSWSPDGRSLLITSRRTGTSDVWVADVASGALRQLTTDVRNDNTGVWSPDGRWVLFASDRGGQWDLWIVAAEGGAARRVTSDFGREFYHEWAPDGRSITYSTSSSSSAIAAVPAEGGAFRTLKDLSEFSAFFLAVSPDSRTVLFNSNRSGDDDIWSLPLAGGEPTRAAFSPTPVYDGQAQWSPDGSRFAFVSSRAGGQQDVFVQAAAGGEATRLTDWSGYDGSPRWSPDGSSIAYGSSREGTAYSLWVVPAAGGAARRLTPVFRDVWDYRWAPDGASLVYSADNSAGRGRFYRIPVRGGTPREIGGLPPDVSVRLFHVSPGGAHLAYTTGSPATFIAVSPTAGGPMRRLLEGSTAMARGILGWSPDGSWLLATRRDSGEALASYWRVPFPEGAPVRLTNLGDTAVSGGVITPDGRTVVFVTSQRTSRIVRADVSRLLRETP